MSRASWTTFDRWRFALEYGWAKLRVPFLTERPRWALFEFEVRYSLVNLVNTFRAGTLAPARYRGPSEITTEGCRFKLRPGTHDAAILSPAFERADVARLRALLDAVGRRRAETWFVDVGANVGAFTVRVARAYPSVRVFACEAAPANVASLAEHVAMNALENVTIFAGAALDEPGVRTFHFDHDRPGDSRLTSGAGLTVECFRLDDRLPRVPPDLGLVIKADVEGFESPALRGLVRAIGAAAEVHLVVEDMVAGFELHATLADLNFRVDAKRTPYNSWWIREPAPT